MQRRLLAVAVAAALAPLAQAGSLVSMDVRASGMGGTGVASAMSASAATFNPALMSAQREDDDFQFTLNVGARVADEDDFAGQAEDIVDTVDALDDLANQPVVYDVGVVAAQLDDMSRLSSTLSGQLNGISGDAIRVSAGGGVAVGVPGKKVGVGVYANADVMLAGAIYFDPADTLAVDTLAGLLDGGVVTAGEVKQAVQSGSISKTGQQFTVNTPTYGSQGNTVGLLSTEIGVALSHQYELSGGRLSVGITPKLIELTAYDYLQTLDNFDVDDLDNAANETSDSVFEADIGAVYELGETPWRVGLVVKNLADSTIKTVNGRDVGLSTQSTVGVAHRGDKLTVAADLDLTEYDPLGFGNDQQYLGLGVEYTLSVFDLRAGYRTNLANGNVADLVTAGLGLGPVELSVMADTSLQEEVGAFAQVSFGW